MQMFSWSDFDITYCGHNQLFVHTWPYFFQLGCFCMRYYTDVVCSQCTVHLYRYNIMELQSEGYKAPRVQ